MERQVARAPPRPPGAPAPATLPRGPRGRARPGQRGAEPRGGPAGKLMPGVVPQGVFCPSWVLPTCH